MISEQADRIEEKLDRIAEGLENLAGKKNKDDFDNVADEERKRETKRPQETSAKRQKRKTNNEPKETVQTDSQTSPAGHALRRGQLLIAL